MDYKYIIWDWNGTLLNDVSASLASVNDMLLKRSMPVLDIDAYRDCIGVPIEKFYRRVFDLDKENYSDILAEYNEGYLAHLKDCSLTSGSEELLMRFKESGCRQVIVSSSNNDQLVSNVKKYGVYSYFDKILGSADYYAQSKIERAVSYLENSEPGKALVIGDLEHDGEMASKLGADCFLITSGHEKRERLLNSGAKIFDTMSEIEAYLFGQ